MKLALARRVGPLVLGCALGVATVAVLGPSPGARASAATPASCASFHANVDGRDSGESIAYGNEGYIYVNTSSTLNALQDDIYRSLFVFGPGSDDVEVGWTAGNGLFSNTPVVYAEWINKGVDSGRQEYRGYTLNPNGTYHFKVENLGDKGIWRFVVDGQSQPFNYSPTMAFNSGLPVNNSERYNNCDSLYASFTYLKYASSPGVWTGSYKDLECDYETANGWYFHKNSNSSSDVTQTSGIC